MKNILSVIFFSLLYAQFTDHTTRKGILLTLEIIYSGLENLLLYFKTTLIISLVIQELRFLVPVVT